MTDFREIGDRIAVAARDRDRFELRLLAREYGYTYLGFVRHEGRAELTLRERDEAERAFRAGRP